MLSDAIRRMEVDALSIAEVWRRAGAVAEGHGLTRPGYHSVLALVLDERRRRADRREALSEAAGEIWAHRGTDYEKLARRLVETQLP